MKTTPLVTGICCTHNRPLFARRAVELFQAQTWPNKELVLMDDGDPGLEDLGRQPGVRRVHTSGYEGMTRKHRWAFEIARGDYICYWDDDDWFSPRRLEVQASAMESGAADATGFPIDLIASTPGTRCWRWKPATLSDWKESSEKEKPVGSRVPFHDGTAMFRRQLLEGLPRETREGWSLQLLDAMISRGARLLSLPNEQHFVYVRHGGNAWRFELEDRCLEVERPTWIPREMVDFWDRTEPAAEARAALAGREADHNGL